MDTPGTSPLPLDAFGWLAASLTWMTFFCSDMRRLRVLGLAANAAFIVYAATAQLWPVLALHVALVPVNLWRLRQVVVRERCRPDAPTEPRRARATSSRTGRPSGSLIRPTTYT